jgi:tetratricopeptide (TPR) repeat protein
LHEVPPLPDNIQDEEVREYLSAIRNKVAEDRGSADAWGELGVAYLANLLDRDADVCLAEAARLNPRDVRWPYVRAVIASKRDPVNAIPLLRKAATASQPSAKYRSMARLFLAELLLEQGELDEAEQIYREELPNRTSADRATLGLGLVARARGENAAAVELLTKAHEHPSSRIQATIQLAALARARGDVEEAEKLEAEAAALPDDAPWPDPMLAELSQHKVGRRAREGSIADLENKGDFAGAARAYLRQADEKPTAEAYVGAAVNLARLHQYDLANQYLQKAAELDPERSKTHYTIALVNMTWGEQEMANDPDSPQATRCFRRVVSSAQRATELKPDYAQAYLFWGLALNHLGETKAAIEPLRKGVACRPDLFDLQLALGQVLLETDQTQEAQQALENAKRLRPDDPRPARLLGELADSK